MSPRFAVLSTGRQDWGILRSTCHALRGRCELTVLAGGMAADNRHGDVARTIEAEGFNVLRLPWEHGPRVEEAIADAARVVGAALRPLAPDALVLLGDRLETAAAAVAATTLAVPLVHLHGGEETEGAFDNALRHAITKMAHLHFVSHPRYAQRVLQMGEADGAVHVVGAPGLDNLFRDDLPRRDELERTLDLDLSSPVVLVTVHPATLSAAPLADAEATIAAMDAVEATYVITLPNADPGAEGIRRLLEAAALRGRRVARAALGERNYWGMLRVADALLGNSSSALIEAPAVALPAVNVGERQAGRLREANVIDVDASAVDVERGLRRALDPAFRASLTPSARAASPAGARIAETLLSWRPPRPPRKRFVDR